jgi:polygalacturonase
MVNGDGLDIDSCCDFNVFHCTIASQDDCIAVKSGMNEAGRIVGIPSERIRITNCSLLSEFGVVCGSDMSGDVRDVLVQDCVFTDAFTIGQMKTKRGRGGVIERVFFENCMQFNRDRFVKDCLWYRGGICIDAFYSIEDFDINEVKPIDEGTPTIRDITFKNIVLDTVGGNAVYISGLPERPIENIHLENVVALGNNDIVTHHVNNLTMKNVRITERKKN